jgi:hypothetical protein
MVTLGKKSEQQPEQPAGEQRGGGDDGGPPDEMLKAARVRLLAWTEDCTLLVGKIQDLDPMKDVIWAKLPFIETQSQA